MKKLLKNIRARFHNDIQEQITQYKQESANIIEVYKNEICKMIEDNIIEIIQKMEVDKYNVSNLIMTNNSDKMFFSCHYISDFYLTFQYIDTCKAATLCCEFNLNLPASQLFETGQETIQHVLRMRADIIQKSVLYLSGGLLPDACAKCSYYKLDRWINKEQINYINLSMQPAPCQCKCIYCMYARKKSSYNISDIDKYYSKVVDALSYAKSRGLISPNVRYQISSGEFAIHPYKIKLLDIIGNSNATFYTNCFKFDCHILNNLINNPRSSINLSIDSGTSETWHKIKGFNNFDTIINNLLKYKDNVKRGQITLKYIMLPGINNRNEDYMGVVKLMKILDVPTLTISRDVTSKYVSPNENNDKLITSTANMISTLKNDGLEYRLNHFFNDEIEKIMEFVNCKC